MFSVAKQRNQNVLITVVKFEIPLVDSCPQDMMVLFSVGFS